MHQRTCFGLSALLFCTVLALLSFPNCKKDLEEPDPGPGPGPTTDTVYFTVDGISVSLRTPRLVRAGYAIIDGDFKSISASVPITEYGFCWSSQDSLPRITDAPFSTLGERLNKGSFTDTLAPLKPNTKYWYTLYFISDNKITYHPLIKAFITPAPEVPVIFTLADTSQTGGSSISNITQHSATVSGKMDYAGTNGVSRYGHCWGPEANPEIGGAGTDTSRFLGPVLNSTVFVSNLDNLNLFTDYHIRAYAYSTTGQLYYGDDAMFTTNNITVFAPTVITDPASDITTTTAILHGKISSTGGGNITESGFVYDVNPDPTVQTAQVIALGAQPGQVSFTHAWQGLSPATSYYVRAYARNNIGYRYGENMEVVTLSPNTNPPVVQNIQYANLGTSAVDVSGQVLEAGGGDIVEYGFVWSGASQEPTLDINQGTAGNLGTPGAAIFSKQITGLQPNFTYWIRAYAKNSVNGNYSYGNPALKITTFCSPEVAMGNITPTQTTAILTGNIDCIGMAGTAEDHGHCWATTPNPTVSNAFHSNGSTGNVGGFQSDISGLSAGTAYYIRAYIKSGGNTYYSTGPGTVFNTISNTDCATIQNGTITAVTTTTATATSKVVYAGGGNITNYGHVWSKTTQQPTVQNNNGIDNKTGNPGTANFVSNMTGLTPNQQYWVRAFTKNSNNADYCYGEPALAFITYCTPSTSMGGSTIIGQTTASFIGNIECIGAAGTISQHGHCWSTSPNPTINDPKTTLGSTNSVGGFTSSLTGLLPGISYYIKSYITTGGNTYYSQNGSGTTFTTVANIDKPSIATNDAVNISANKFTAKGVVTALGCSNISEYGFCYSTVNIFPTILDSKKIVGNNLSQTVTFETLMDCLDASTTYYVAAYATNNCGTAYGAVKTINTSAGFVVPCNLMAYYTFDSQNANDLSINGWHGTANSGISYSTDKPNSSGYSASFNGTDGKISVNVPINVGTRALSFWIKTTDPSFTIMGVGYGVNYLFGSDKIGENNSIINQWQSITNTAWVIDASWHHIVINRVQGSNLFELYKDGQIWVSGPAPNISFVNLSGNKFELGAGSAEGYLSGKIDNFRLYNVPLTSEQVQKIYQAKQ